MEGMAPNPRPPPAWRCPPVTDSARRSRPAVAITLIMIAVTAFCQAWSAMMTDDGSSGGGSIGEWLVSISRLVVSSK